MMIYTRNRMLARGVMRIVCISIMLIIAVTSMTASVGFAQNGQAPVSELRVAGLLIDRTMTPIGQHFFQLFSSAWIPPENMQYENITVVERFNPQWGSMIWISVDDDELFEKIMLSRNKDLTELANSVASAIEQFLLKRELLRHVRQSNDLLGDGLR
jgi:curli production assembly/transport component CsgE